MIYVPCLVPHCNFNLLLKIFILSYLFHILSEKTCLFKSFLLARLFNHIYTDSIEWRPFVGIAHLKISFWVFFSKDENTNNKMTQTRKLEMSKTLSAWGSRIHFIKMKNWPRAQQDFLLSTYYDIPYIQAIKDSWGF